MKQCQPNSAANFPELIGGKVHYNNRVLDLSSKPITAKLFKLTIENLGITPSRYDLIEQIYHVDPVGCSERLRLSLQHNLTKLISRARRAAFCAFETDAVHNWFIYNPILDNYTLIQGLSTETNFRRLEAMP